MAPLALSSPAPPPATFVEGGIQSLAEIYRQRHARLSGAGRFVQLLAEGGMGAVLLVEQVPGVGRGPFALKLMRRDLLASPEAVARFRREILCHARLARELQVPRLVPCLGAHVDPDPALSWALFPYYSEGTLEDQLARGLCASEALLLLAGAVEGLQSLHGHGYVHRDLHPRNIFVEREGGRRRGVLGDLGVGLFRAGNTLVSQDEIDADTARRIGHPGYVDPLEGATPAADLYGVGATLFRILAGREPEEHPHPGPLGLVLERTPRGFLRGAGLGRRAAELLERLTSSDRCRRFASAREARVEIVALAEQAQRSERRGGVIVARSDRPEPRGRRAPTRPLRWAALAVAFVASMAALAALLMRASTFPEVTESGPAEGESATQVGIPAPAFEVPLEVPDQVPSEIVHSAVSAPEERPEEGADAKLRSPVATPKPHAPVADLSLPAPKRRIETQAPGAPSPRPRPVERDLETADLHLRGGQPAAAERALRGVLLEDPAQPDAAVRLALLLAAGGAQGREEGVLLLGRALDSQPARGDLRLTLARLLLQVGKSEGAEELLAAAPATSSHRAELAALAAHVARAPRR